MIEIGKQYRLITLELTDGGYDQGTIYVTVTGRDGNLLEVNNTEIINMASPLFHSLTDTEAQKSHYEALHARIIGELDDDTN